MYYGVSSVLNPDVVTVTQSDLSAFIRDRRSWFLGSYLGLRSKAFKSTGPLVLGSLIHEAMERYYAWEEDLVEAFMDEVYKAEQTLILADRNYSVHEWQKQAALGKRMCEGFVEWVEEHNIDSQIRVVDIEKRLEVRTSYDGVPVILTGKADMIVEDRLTGSVSIYDHKTTANLTRTIEQARTTIQLPFYMTLQEATDPGQRVSGAAYTILLKSMRQSGRGPFYHRERVTYTPHGLAARRSQIHGAIRDYVRVVSTLHEGVKEPMEYAYPNHAAPSWSNSGYRLLAEAIDGGDDVARMIRDLYVQKDPYARYRDEKSMIDD